MFEQEDIGELNMLEVEKDFPEDVAMEEEEHLVSIFSLSLGATFSFCVWINWSLSVVSTYLNSSFSFCGSPTG